MSRLSKIVNKLFNPARVDSPKMQPARPRVGIMALEPRVMFDGAMAATVVAEHHAAEAVAKPTDGGHHGEPVAPHLFDAAMPPVAAHTGQHEIVFVDSTLPDWQSLVQNAPRDAQVVMLDPTRDGMDQIAQALAGRHDIEAVHIVSHGGEGYLVLGNTMLSSYNLDQYSADTATIRAALAPGADIHLYGCDVVGGSDGEAFVQQLAHATGADVAASTNDTGAHGDWVLEFSTGAIQTRSMSDPAYQYDLDTIEVTNLNDSGAGSLRQAVTDATGNDRADTIVFDPALFASGAQTLTLTSGGLDVAGEGDNDAFNIIGPGSSLLTISGNNSSQIFMAVRDHTDHTSYGPANTSAVSIAGMTLTGGKFGYVYGVTGYGGGAVVSQYSGDLTLDHVVFKNNNASGNYHGGGVYFLDSSHSVSISNSTFDSNSAGTSAGGALLVGQNVSISNSTFVGNTSTRSGGAATITAKGNLSISNSTFYGNTAGSTGNNRGGALDIENGTGTLRIVNSTIVGNHLTTSAGQGGGGGLFVRNNTIELYNNLIANNTSSFNGPDIVAYQSGVIGGSNNIIGTAVDTLPGSTNPGTNNLTGTISTLPTMGALAYNGGAVKTISIDASGSAANAGIAAQAPATDARGYDRGSTVDIGAYEVHDAGTFGFAGSLYPPNGYIDMPNAGDLSLEFGQAVTAVAGKNITIHNGDGSVFETIAATDARVSITAGVGGAGSRVVIDPAGVFVGNGQYYVLIDAGAFTDAQGDTFTGIQSASDWAFVAAVPAVVPAITSATYDASTGTLAVTGTDMTAGGTIDVSKLTLTGQNGGSYTLTSADVTASSGTAFTVVLNAADRVGVNGLLNRNGTIAVDATAFNLAGAAGWDSTAGAGADLTGNGVTVSNVIAPTITSATYDASTHVLTVNGSNLVGTPGANNDIAVSKLTLRGEGFTSYTLTSPDVEVTGAGGFSVTLNATDRAAVEQMLNKNGTSSTNGTTYNLAAADDWNSVIGNTDISDATNAMTVSNVPAPTITSASYDASTGSLTVTGSGFLSLVGASNDIVANKFTFTGDGGATYTLTDTANVDITSGTSFTLVLSANDRMALNLIVNRNGTSSTGFTPYNLAAADNWAAGADAALTIGDLTGNGITVSNVAVPAITSATYDAATGTVVVTGTGFLPLYGASNDVVANKFTFTGEGGATYTLTDTANVEITSGTSFTLVLSATDKAGVDQLIDKNGIQATDNTFYNLAAADDWAAGIDAALSIGDTTGNGITASNVDASAVLTPSGGTTAFVEGSSVAVDGGLGLADSDSTTMASAVVSLTGGFQSGQDVLALANAGSYGDIAASYNAGTGVLTLNSAGAASLAQWQAALRAVQYTNTSDDPNTGTRTVSFVINDGTRDSLAVTKSVSVTGVNDAPTLTANPNPAPYFTEGGSAPPLFFTAGINTVEAGQSIHALTLTVGGVADGASEILVVDGTNVALTNGNVVTTASNGYTATVTLSGGVATVAITKVGDYSTSAAQVLVNGLKYSNGSDNPTVAGGRTITLVSIQDDGGTANGGVDTTALSISQTVTLAAVNDAPVVTTDSGSAAFTAGDNTVSMPVAVDAGITVADVDNGTLASATVSITGNFHAGEDVLAFTNDGATMGDITASYNASTGVLTLSSASGTVTLAQWQAALRSVAYTDTAVTPDMATRTVSFTVNDGAADSTVATRTVTVAATDQTPIVTTTGGSTNYVGGASAVTIDSGITVSDRDDTTQSSATVSITTGFHSGDVLGFVNTSSALFGDIVASYNALTGVMTLTSTGATATNAQWASALSSVTFASASTSYGARTIAFAVNDGDKTSAVATDTVNLLGLPTVTDVGSSTADGSYKVGDTIALTVDFDQAVVVDDSGGTPTLRLETGSVDREAVYVGGSGSSTLTFSYTVQAGDASADLDYASTAALALNGGSIRSGAGVDAVLTLPATGGADSVAGQHAIVVDGVAPTVDSVAAPANGTYVAGQNLDFTVNYSEAVTVDTTSGTPRIAITLDTGGTVYADYLSGSGTTALVFRYTVATGQNDANGITLAGAIDLNGGSIRDAVGNAEADALNSVATTTNVRVDAVAPTASIALSDTALKIGDTATVTIHFSEAVSGLTTADFSVANGSLSGLSSSDGGVTWTATFAPASSVTDASNLIVLDNTGYLDAAGNTGTGTSASANYAIDTVRPTTASIALSDTAVKAGETSNVTITFSEAVSGLDAGDFTVDNGSLGGLASSDGGITWTATFTPTADVTDASNLIVLDNTGYTDAAGNAGIGTSASPNYAIDTARPTASIALSDTALKLGDTSTVTITFSEAVSGLTIADFTVANGSLSGLASRDGGVVWTATFTPTADATDASNLITLDNTGVTDAAGNTGMGTTTSSAYAVDTRVPQVVSIQRDGANPNSGQHGLDYTATFDENVEGVDAADFVLVATGNAHGTIGAVDRIDGRSFTVHLENVGGSGSLQLNLAAAGSGITDSAGNALAAGAEGETYTVAGVAPVVLPVPVILPTAPGITHGSSVSPLLSLQPADLPTIYFSEAAPAPLFALPTERVGGVLDGLAWLSRDASASSRDVSAWPPSIWVAAGKPFDMRLPSRLDGQSVLQVTLADGRPLPPWLHFDPVAGTLDGTPPAHFGGTLSLQVTVLDAHGQVRIIPLTLSASDGGHDRQARAERPADDADGKPLATAKPALQAQFGQQRQHGTTDHASLLHHLAVARQQQAAQAVRS
jgi:hypothetical protein